MLKSAFIYLFGGTLNRAIPFLLLPVLTRYLSPEEYGTLAIFQVVLAFFIPFIGMNMQSNISRNFGKMDRYEMGTLVGTLTGLLGVTAGIVGVIAAAWVFWGGGTFGLPGGWVLVLPLVAALSMAHQFNLTVLRNQQRPLRFGIFEVCNTLLNLILSLALVVGLGFGWQGRAAGAAVASCCFGLVGLLALRQQKLLIFKYERALLFEVLRISLPLIPHALGGVVIVMSDRLFIDRMVGKEMVGLYVVGYAFGTIVNLVIEAFNRTWGPWFYREMVNITGFGRRRIVKFSYAYFGGVVCLAVAVTTASHVVLPFMVAPEYSSAIRYVGWIAAGYAFRGMYTMVFPYLIHEARTNFLGIMTAVAAILNLVGNYFLIKLNGPVGAAQSTALAFAISFLGTWWYAQKIHPMPWSPKKLFVRSSDGTI